MTTNTRNWEAAANVAAGLGIHTRELVATRDAESVGEWALQLASANGICPRGASYYELAVLVGHVAPPPEPAKEAKPDE
jgi:hypothetical protein